MVKISVLPLLFLSLVAAGTPLTEKPHPLTDVETDHSKDEAPPALQSPLPSQASPTVETPPEEKSDLDAPIPTETRANDEGNPEAVLPRNATSEEYKGSASESEPRFDWSKHKGETTVHHPDAEKGLIRITKDRTYYYKVDESPQHSAASFQAGPFTPTQLSNPSGGQYASFASNYPGANQPAFLVTKEWQIVQGMLGKIGIQAGSGMFIAQGNGHFADYGDAYYQGKTPEEVFTFIALPNSVGAVYRLQFQHRQLFVPYIAGGGTVYTFLETRDDNKAPKFGGALAAYGAGGIALNMTYFDYLTRVELDREYGINEIYLIAEYRQIAGFTTYDFSGSFVNAGFLVEY